MNNKKIQKNKKHRVGLFLGIGLATILAGSTGVLLTSLKNNTKPLDPIYFNLKFDKGTGTSIQGQTDVIFQKETCLAAVDVPCAKKIVGEGSSATEYFFVDWVDENGLTVEAGTPITKSTKLTATYSDTLPKNSYHYVSFITTDEEEYLTGITKLAVPKGRTFASINKPQVHIREGSTKNLFKGWALSSNTATPIDPDMKIESDITLVPSYATAVQLTFNAGDRVEKVSGTETIDTESNTKFSNINQPTYKTKASEEKQLYLEAWYDEPIPDSPTTEWKAEHKIKPNDLIPAKSEITIYANWTDNPQDNVLLNFVQNESEGQPRVEYQGNTEIVVDLDTQWANINRPNPFVAGCNVLKWQLSTDQIYWDDIADDHIFTERGSYYLRPIMEKNLDSLLIVGPSTVSQTSEQQYEAVISPEGIKTGLTWGVYKDSACMTAFEEGEVTIDTTGLLKTTTAAPEKAYIKVYSTLNPDKSAKLEVAILPPYVQACDYFTFDDATQKWYKLSNLFDDQSIEFEPLLGEETIQPETRETFNRKVYVGNQVTTIEGGFLNSCTNFNNEIVISSNTTRIGDLFLAKCTKFNKKLDLSNIQHIGNSFMVNCESFNNGSSINADNTLELTSILTIGDRFLSAKLDGTTYATSFNSLIVLGTSVTSIGQEFLLDNKKFNKSINFPSSLKSVGDLCMYGCDDFTATLTADCAASAFSDNYANFASKTENSQIYKTGFNIVGLKAAEFAEQFGEISQKGGEGRPYGSSYRKTKVLTDGDFSTARWSYLIKQIEKFEEGTLSEAEFCNLFTYTDSTGAKKRASKLSDYVGQVKTITIFGYSHKVTVQGSCYDERDYSGKNTKIIQYKDAEGNTKNATFVFGFSQVIQDYGVAHNGDGVGGQRLFRVGDKATDYLNSQLRKTVNGNGNGSFYYRKTSSTLPAGKPVIDSMPAEIVAAMKTPINRQSRVYRNGAWVNLECPDKFFIPTLNELYGVTADGTDTQGFMWTNEKVYGAAIAKNHRWSNAPSGAGQYYMWTSSPSNGEMHYSIHSDCYIVNNSYSYWTDFSIRPFWAI